ncbi:MAG: hypothetical protein II855_06330 [Candidatus Methanomethylophilaceae archaeon]|nr:hypothetical protein [Candidatus Methanomethylophilaceae archaeon]
MGVIVLRCPHCHGNLELDDSREFGLCQYCGSKVMIEKNIAINNLLKDGSIQEKKRLKNLIRKHLDNGNYDCALTILKNIEEHNQTDYEYWLLLLEYTYREAYSTNTLIDNYGEKMSKIRDVFIRYKTFSADSRSLKELIDTFALPPFDFRTEVEERCKEEAESFHPEPLGRYVVSKKRVSEYGNEFDDHDVEALCRYLVESEPFSVNIIDLVILMRIGYTQDIRYVIDKRPDYSKYLDDEFLKCADLTVWYNRKWEDGDYSLYDFIARGTFSDGNEESGFKSMTITPERIAKLKENRDREQFWRGILFKKPDVVRKREHDNDTKIVVSRLTNWYDKSKEYAYHKAYKSYSENIPQELL